MDFNDKLDKLIENEDKILPVGATESENDTKEEKAQVPVFSEGGVGRVTRNTEFSKAMNEVNLNFVKNASVEDKKFNNEVTDMLKDAVKKNAEVEKKLAELDAQNVEYHKELLATQQLLNEYKQKEDAWENKKRARQYHFDGVAPILKMVGIEKPMHLLMLYALVVLLIVPFLVVQTIKGTFGALVIGSENGKTRPAAMKAFLCTLFALICVVGLAVGVYLLIDWLHPFGWLV